jgi:hypothetical protein
MAPRLAVIRNRTMIALEYEVPETARMSLKNVPVLLAAGHQTLSV